MDIQLKKGVLDICVLRYLEKEDSYGYKIIQGIVGYVQISESTLYPILKRLEKSGCVKTYTQEYNGRLRKYYSITKTGKERVQEFIIELSELEKLYDFILNKGDELNE